MPVPVRDRAHAKSTVIVKQSRPDQPIQDAVAAMTAELDLHQRIERIDGILLGEPDLRPETAPILTQMDAVGTVDHAVFQKPGQPAEMIFVHVGEKNRADAVEIDFFPDQGGRQRLSGIDQIAAVGNFQIRGRIVPRHGGISGPGPEGDQFHFSLPRTRTAISTQIAFSLVDPLT